MELIDVLERNGNSTGLIKSRDKIHRDGDWHRSVHVWIKNNRDEILIQKRSAIIDLFKNYWDISLVGHVLSGEKSITAAQRELKEELGIEARVNELRFIGTVKSALKDGPYYDNQFCDIYFLFCDTELIEMKKQKEEVAQIKFIPLNELETFMQKNSDAFVPRTEEYKKILRYLRSNP